MQQATTSSSARELFITGLKNAHAVEAEASQIIERQLDRLENYPAVRARLSEHLRETNTQRERLERLLQQFGESPSRFKDMVAGFMGNMAALAHTPATDEVLKNHFANNAFENYEIAAYRSLIALAEANGLPGVPDLRQSLSEEEAMMKWLTEHTEELTRQYAARYASGQKADR